MRILIWPADEWGCAHYRLLFPAWALMAEGADVEVTYRGPTLIWDHKWPGADEGREPPPNAHVLGLATVPQADVVVLQRPSRRWWADIIPLLQGRGLRVVVDVDDRYDAIDRRNVNAFDPTAPHIGAEWIEKAVRVADVVTCTTPALAERYGRGKAVVLPNLVPASYLAIPTGRHRVPNTVGWPALARHHPGDLAVTRGAIGAALGGTNWQLRVPSIDGVFDELGSSPRRTFVFETGGVRIWDWPRLIAQNEIGIVPLAPGDFNDAKSALKASEMAALGIPVVMSPTPDNRRLHDLGVGVLARTHEQWRDELRRLMGSADLRASLGGLSRAVMARQTYEEHAGRWLEAWTGKAKAQAAA